MRRGTRRRSGVTLIELLVACAVIGVLISITIPAVGAARSAAFGEKTHSDIHQSVSLVSSYAASAKGFWPFVPPEVGADGLATDRVRIAVHGGGTVSLSYFAQALFWHAALESRGYDTRGVSSHWSVQSRYRASQSFLAAPSYWEESAAQDRREWGVQRLSAVRSAAGKALIYERASDGDGLKSVGFVDAHVERRSVSDAGEWVVNRLTDVDSGPLATTRRGTHGSDY